MLIQFVAEIPKILAVFYNIWFGSGQSGQICLNIVRGDPVGSL